MAGVCRVTLIGNIGRDPELRYTASGTAVANISVATSFKRKGGEETTAWHKVTLYDKLAEICSQYASKGSQVYVEGRLNYTSYTDKSGVEKQQTEIIASELQVLGQRGQQKREEEPRHKADDEDVPF